MHYWVEIRSMLVCVPSSLHKYLIIWHLDGSIEVVKVDAKLFIVTSNVAVAQLYRYRISNLFRP